MYLPYHQLIIFTMKINKKIGCSSYRSLSVSPSHMALLKKTISKCMNQTYISKNLLRKDFIQLHTAVKTQYLRQHRSYISKRLYLLKTDHTKYHRKGMELALVCFQDDYQIDINTWFPCIHLNPKQLFNFCLYEGSTKAVRRYEDRHLFNCTSIYLEDFLIVVLLNKSSFKDDKTFLQMQIEHQQPL